MCRDPIGRSRLDTREIRRIAHVLRVIRARLDRAERDRQT